MPTVLENYYNLRSEVDKRIAQGNGGRNLVARRACISHRCAGNLPDVLQNRPHLPGGQDTPGPL